MEVVVTIGALALAGVVWLVRLEGRVESQREALAQLRADVQYIRARIDQALAAR